MRVGRHGIALIAALLTLASLSTLGVATFLLVSYDLRLAENRQEQALARARATSLLTLALLAVEAESAGGELPASSPGVAGIIEYTLLDGRTAVLVVEGSEGSARHRSSARIALEEGSGGWRLHIVDRR